MSCKCIICETYGVKPTHVGFVDSAFTKNPLGYIAISNLVLPDDSMCAIFRINKSMSTISSGQSLELPTSTMEDILHIEVCAREFLSLQGQATLTLAQAMPGSIDLELQSEFEVSHTISFTLQFISLPLKRVNGFVLYKETFSSEVGKSFLDIKADRERNQVAANDREQQNIWSKIGFYKDFSTIEFVLTQVVASKQGTMTEYSKRIVEKSAIKAAPYLLVIKAPLENIFIRIYITPVFNEFYSNPRSKLTVTFPQSSNLFLCQYTDGYMEMSVKSTAKESLQDPEKIPLENFVEEIENSSVSFNYSTYTSEDKLVIKVFTYPDGPDSSPVMATLGLLKFKEIHGFSREQYSAHIQLSSESLNLMIGMVPETPKRQEGGAREGAGTQEDIPLTFKEQAFFDVLDLLNFKISRIKHKNLNQRVTNQKLTGRHNILLKTFHELDHAHSAGEFGSIVERSKLKSSGKKTNENNKEITMSSYCACGNSNPKFKGYCEDCVRKLKEQYEKLLGWYAPIETEYEKLENQLKSLSTKRYLLTSKIEKLERKLAQPPEMISDIDQENEIRSLKLEISNIQNSMKICEEETNRKTQEFNEQESTILAKMHDTAYENKRMEDQLVQLEGNHAKINEDIEKSEDRLVFMQKFNQKHSKKQVS